MTFEPEIGQMLFGQPYKENDLPFDWEQCIHALGALIDRCHGADPTGNVGAVFDCDAFSMHSYSWSDDEQPWNFKWRDVRISWYKHAGRSASCNDATIMAPLSEMMLECIPDIPRGVLS